MRHQYHATCIQETRSCYAKPTWWCLVTCMNFFFSVKLRERSWFSSVFVACRGFLCCQYFHKMVNMPLQDKDQFNNNFYKWLYNSPVLYIQLQQTSDNPGTFRTLAMPNYQKFWIIGLYLARLPNGNSYVEQKQLDKQVRNLWINISTRRFKNSGAFGDQCKLFGWEH